MNFSVLHSLILYSDVNSRFVYKGLIHKLVNQLAAKFDLSSSWQLATSSQREKQNKYDKCPAFILNLQCPTSYYDIVASERSRTSVEFKDWAPILAFIEDGVMRLWTENMSHDMLGNLESGKRRCRKQNSLIPPDICSPDWKKPCKDHNYTLPLEETVFTFGKSCRKLKRHEVEADLICDTDYISQGCDKSLVGQAGIREEEIKNHMSPWNVFSPVHVTNSYGRNKSDLSSAIENILPAYNENDSMSIVCGGSIDCLYSDDEEQDHSISFLRGCSFDKSLMQETRSPSRFERFGFGCNGYGTKRRRIDCCDITKDEINLILCDGDFQCSAAQLFQYSPGTKFGMHGMLVSPVRDSVKSSFLGNTLSDSEQFWKPTSSLQSFRFGWSPVTMKEVTGIKFCDEDSYPIEKSFVEGHSGFGKDIIHGYPTLGDVQDLRHSLEDTEYNWLEHNCSFMEFPPDTKRKIGETQWDFENLFPLKPFKRFTDEDRSTLPFFGEESLKNYSWTSSNDTSQNECERGMQNGGNQGMLLNRKKSFTRSHSAPPYYRGKRRFLDLTDTSFLSAKNNFQNNFAGHSSIAPSNSRNGQLDVETMNLKCSEKPFGQFHLSPMEKPAISVLETKPEIIAVQNRGPKEERPINIGHVERLDLKEFQDSLDSGLKWRNCSLPTAGENRSDVKKNQDSILDIFSDILQLDGDSLVPKSIERACLENAKVLNQVDKKFIAVVAGKTLAIIDQHAADERIKLEELRHNVLSGEMKTIKYLDSEHELVLPEVGYQLLHNYAEQIKTWGWICNIHSQDSNSFTKHLDFLHRKPTVVKLLAVPCILGVTLNDIDLLEFLQQLADTDGSSTTPPSVHRVLNSKACRGAIMFGDTLLPSECSLIVEELKRTSLCFQCAHGRPTTVPLVNLDPLHNKVARLGSDESWHGLRQHKLSLKRTSQRLRAALS